MRLIYLKSALKCDSFDVIKSALKCDSFDVTIGIKTPFFRVSVTIKPGCSLLSVRYHEREKLLEKLLNIR